ncbi:F-box/LRR-repeat protein 5-like [Ptychodera flava]|uniref:F-box/LRR-repeat protein 5-like n=1 Tax=Ptychodera flava TaxID=63121 RepID=UPI003969D037
MAPAPAEVDVFTIPHSKIVEQLKELTDKLSRTNFSNHVDWEAMLNKIRLTFSDFKIHEKIENECIMQKLKHRLKGLKIEIAAVTNVHSDNHLTDMLEMVDDGLKRNWDKTEDERNSFGKLLTKALKEFTKDFLPHLKEEEEVFQELLMRYFSYEELKDIKATVIERHGELHSKLKYLKDTAEKPTEDEPEEDILFHLLPTEIIMKIFSLLSPKDLCHCAQVCRQWSNLAFSGSTWRALYPCRWAKGIWEFGMNAEEIAVPLSESDSSPANSESEDDLYVVVDDDADFDESGQSDNSVSSTLSYTATCIRNEAKMLIDITKYLIPMVGPSVLTLVLSKSKGVTNGLVYKMIVSCPNLQHLDLRQTNISDVAFKGLGRNGAGSRLKHLDLSGCLKITDTTLIRLTTALGMNPPKAEMCCLDACNQGNNNTENVDGHSEVSMATRTLDVDEVAIENCDEVLRKFTKWKISSDEYYQCENTNGAMEECDDGWADGHNNENHLIDSDTEGACIACLRTATADRCPDSDSTSNSNFGDNKNRTTAPHVAVTDCDKNSSSGCCRTFTDNNNVRTETCCGSGCCEERGGSAGTASRPMEFLGLSSCYQITDEGLRALASNGGLPNLRHLDLSGCLNVTGAGLQELAEACPNLEHEQFFYCDNITEGPFQESASGCQNLQCRKRVCCRSGE